VIIEINTTWETKITRQEKPKVTEATSSPLLAWRKAKMAVPSTRSAIRTSKPNLKRSTMSFISIYYTPFS
jgi:hypothetical protein